MNQSDQFQHLYLEEYCVNYRKEKEELNEEKRVEVIQVFGQEE
jgi:hypothetical protein